MRQNCKSIEESPSYDARNRQNQSNFGSIGQSKTGNDDRPIFDDNLQWKVLKPTKAFDESKIDIPDENDRQLIDEIISKFQKGFVIGFVIDDLSDVIDSVQKNQAMIKKWAGQKFVKAIFVGNICIKSKRLKDMFPKKQYYQMLCLAVQETGYPLACVQLAIDGYSYNQKSQRKQEISSLFNIGLEYGQKYVYLNYAHFEMRFGNWKKAYEIFKNALLHEQNLAYLLLGQIFIQGYGQNLHCARKYLQLGKIHTPKKVQNKFTFIFRLLQAKLKTNKMMSPRVISTQQSQSKVISNFIRNKYRQKNKGDPNFDHLIEMNFLNHYFCESRYELITFYVVSAPLIMLRFICFLGEDHNGTIQCIYIKNWNVIESKKLSLLHKLGTRVVLNQYVRRYGDDDKLPYYRTQHPYSVYIYQNSQSHFISDEKYRNFAKILFKDKLYQQAQAIYDHLIEKGADNLEIIYSNKGLIFQNLNQIQQAIIWYKESLKIKKFEKSQLRLAYIFISQCKFLEAENVANEIVDQKQRKLVLQKIEQAKEKKRKSETPISNQQFSKITLNNIKYFKKQIKINKQILQDLQPDPINPKASGPFAKIIQQYLLYFQKEFRQLVKINPKDDLIKTVQKIYDDAELPINEANLKRFSKFFDLAYGEFSRGSHFFHQQNVYFQQSLPYQIMFWSFVHRYPVPQVIQRAKFAISLGKRCHYLENKLEDRCIQLLTNGREQQALAVYKSAKDYVIPFCCKISEILFNQSKHQENIGYSIQIIRRLKQTRENKRILFSIVRLTSQCVKSMIKLKAYKQASIKGEELLDFIKKENPQAICERFEVHNFFATFRCDSDICSLKNNIAISLYFLGNYDKALSYIDQNWVQKNKQNEKELYFSTLILKVRILLKIKNSRQKVLQIISKSMKFVEKITEMGIKSYFKAALLKFLFKDSIEQKDHKAIANYSQQIIQIGSQYASYVRKQLYQSCVKDQKRITSLMSSICGNKDLQVLYEGLFQALQNHFYRKIKEGEVVNQQLIQFLKINKGQDQKQIQSNFEQYEQVIEDLELEIPQTEVEQKQLTFEEKRDYANLFEGFVHVGQFFAGNLEYIVYFSELMKLERKQEIRFMIAAEKLCRTEIGHNGIKIVGDEARIKIKGSARLIGSVLSKQQRRFILFVKKQKHDDYKRKK